MTKQEFKLHSSGENWFHFRLNQDSAMESFSITYCHDGTVVMHGDYGVLAWQREFFPERLDYGFPNKDTWIGYFAEKVVQAEHDQNIRTWKKEDAIVEIKKKIEEYQEEEDNLTVAGLKEVLEELDYFEDGDYGYIQMLEVFNSKCGLLESETFTTFGRCYTEAFERKFEMLVSVSEQILDVIARTRGWRS